MAWLAENWIWVILGLAFIAMHLFGHAGHGSHGCHGSHGSGDVDPKETTAGPAKGPGVAASGGTPGQHRH